MALFDILVNIEANTGKLVAAMEQTHKRTIADVTRLIRGGAYQNG